MRFLKTIFYFLALFFLTTGCQVVKPYQRVYLNDPEMQMGNDVTGKYEERVQDIREGAYPAGSHNKAGGCGCN